MLRVKTLANTFNMSYMSSPSACHDHWLSNFLCPKGACVSRLLPCPQHIRSPSFRHTIILGNSSTNWLCLWPYKSDLMPSSQSELYFKIQPTPTPTPTNKNPPFSAVYISSFNMLYNLFAVVFIFYSLLIQYEHYKDRGFCHFFSLTFIIFTFTYMCVHYLGHLPAPNTPYFWAKPVLPSCSLILLKRKHRR
jgi:hypothetical protein